MPGPTILIVDQARADWGVQQAALVAALQRFVDEQFFPVWGVACRLELTDALRSGCWALAILDDADRGQALGYHDLTPDGLPLSKVFVETTIKDGQLVSATACHELAEMLIDPGLNLTVPTDARTLCAYEVCDPVEGSTFDIDGVAMSNFVYPTWFQGWWPRGSIAFDHLRKLNAPFQLLAHGYIPILRDGTWSKVFGSLPTKEKQARRDLRGHRHDRRGRAHRPSTAPMRVPR